MTQRAEVEKLVVRQFRALHERYGYSGPLIKRAGWFTRIEFSKGDIGIELELDWRDGVLSVLAVRLEHGQLPKDYYVDAGRACRKHLVNVARERRWPNAPPLPRVVRSNRGSGPSPMVEAARTNSDLLLAWLDRLEGEWHEIWR